MEDLLRSTHILHVGCGVDDQCFKPRCVLQNSRKAERFSGPEDDEFDVKLLELWKSYRRTLSPGGQGKLDVVQRHSLKGGEVKVDDEERADVADVAIGEIESTEFVKGERRAYPEVQRIEERVDSPDRHSGQADRFSLVQVLAQLEH